MPKYVKNPTWADGSGGGTRIDAADLNVIEAGIYDSSVGRSTTFPASPVDGEMHVYPADTTNGIMWQFMYRSAPNDWEYIGGGPLSHEIATLETRNNSAYGDLSTSGPTVTVPFAGDWLVSYGALIAAPTSAADIGRIAVKRGGAATSDNDSALLAVPSNASTQAASVSRTIRMNGLSASTVLLCQYKNSAGGNTGFEKRWLFVTPIRHTP